MLCTVTRPKLRLLLLALVCILSMTACKSVSSKQELPQLPQEAPEVRCKQAAQPKPPALPAADEWVTWTPALSGSGTAVLSEKAAAWVVDVLGWGGKIAALRQIEHDCLDKHEKEGLIRQ